MSKGSRTLRVAVSAILSTTLALTMLALAPAGQAEAATATYISLHSIPTPPIAGQPITLQVYTGSLDGSFPAGVVDVMVEGTGMMVGGPVSAANGGIQLGIGNFPIGTITVDASFTPADAATYSPTSAKITLTLAGAEDSVRPLFLSAPTLGKTESADAVIFLDTVGAHAPGGVVSFVVSGVSVGTCTPVATDLIKNWSCTATLPAPNKAGPYTVTAQYGRSSYYEASSGDLTGTVAAAPVPAAPKPVVVASTPTPGPSATSTPSESPSPTHTAVPLAAGAKPTDARANLALSTNSWVWFFLAALMLLIAAGVSTLIVLWRRRMAGSIESAD